jgi:serine/threonine protein kinase
MPNADAGHRILARWRIHFGKYELLSRINIGGMAEIVKACDASLPARPLVAVKRILPHLCDDEQYRTMFLDESRVLEQLDHPNIIHAFEIGEVEGTPYIAMDFVDGQDARTLFHKTHGAENKVPIGTACHIIASVCDGLHHAHEQTDENGEPLGLVHRDVSLQNVLLSYAGDVKITDFGIAVSSQNEARTEVGIVKGKFGYMSPEQIRGAPLDRRSDLFGAGICLYELLTGERLFIGDNDYKAIEKVRNVTIDPPSKLNRNIPSELERIVMKALAKQTRDRYQTALEMRRDLLAFMAAAGERCTRDDLGAYLRSIFESEYESAGEDATTVGSDSELEAARAALPRQNDLAISAGAAASGAALDGTTGLAAFDHLDPISTVSFAVDPEVASHVRLPAAAAIPSLRSARHSATLPPPGLQPVTTQRASSTTLRPASIPQVPPIVPRPDSVPGSLKTADVLGQNDNAMPEPRPMAMEWDEVEPTTVSKGLSSRPPVPLAADSFDPDEEPTRNRLDEPMPALDSGFGSDAFTPVSEPQRPSDWQGTTSRPPLRDLSSIPAADSFDPPRFEPSLQIKLVGAIVAALVLLAATLYWTHSRGTATIRLTTEPRDAAVTVDGHRVPATSSPFVLANLDVSEEHTIAVDKNGYQGWATRLKLRPDQVLDLPLIKLEPDVRQPSAAAIAASLPPAALMPSPNAPAESSPSVPPPADRSSPLEKHKPRAAAQSGERAPASAKASRTASSGTRDKRAAKPAASKRAPAEPAPAAASGAMGTLRVNSRPWSRVIVDGRLIGNTPQMAIPLRVGKHSLNLVNPEFGIDKTLTIAIKAGEITTHVVTLQ